MLSSELHNHQTPITASCRQLCCTICDIPANSWSYVLITMTTVTKALFVP
jgi:hypothetical protein